MIGHFQQYNQIKMLNNCEYLLLKKYQLRFPRNGLSISGARRYSPGDDIHLINWKLSAKTGETHVHITKPDSGNDLIFIIDISSSMAFSTKSCSKFDIASKILATLSKLAKISKDKVGIVLFSDDICCYRRPSNKTQYLAQLLTKNFCPNWKRTDLLKAMKFVGKTLRKRSNIVILSDIFSLSNERKKLLSEIYILRTRHDITIVNISDANDIVSEKVGNIFIEDLETGESLSIDTNDTELIGSIRTKFSEYRDIVLSDIEKLGVKIVDIDASSDINDSILMILQK